MSSSRSDAQGTSTRSVSSTKRKPTSSSSLFLQVCNRHSASSVLALHYTTLSHLSNIRVFRLGPKPSYCSLAMLALLVVLLSTYVVHESIVILIICFVVSLILSCGLCYMFSGLSVQDL